MPSTALVWFRRDFRLHDNPALVAALHDADRVVAVYLHAPDEEAPWQPGAASNWWRHHSLAALATAIAERGGRLTLRRGDSLAMLRELIRETGAQSVHWNRLYEPAIRARDEQIKAALKADGIIARSHNSALLFEPWSLKTQADQPYRVFSPFWRNGEPQLVNARTPGYQKHVLTTSSFVTELDRELGRDASLVRATHATAFEQGRIIARDDPFAMALQGPGMFTVQTPSGLAYTRNGDFTVGTDGTLRTRAGYEVQGADGPLRFDGVSAAGVVVEPDGTIYNGDVQVGKLRIVEFEHRHELQRVSETLFADPDGKTNPQPATETAVHHRNLEFPRGSTITGMVAMIAASRAFESAQRAARVMDESYEKLNKQG